MNEEDLIVNRPWKHLRVDRRSPRYSHVTFDHPPINTITATTVAELGDLAGLIERGGPMARLSRVVGRGRALEILLVADDLDGPRAEQYGYDRAHQVIR
jgi:hypothetical protein